MLRFPTASVRLLACLAGLLLGLLAPPAARAAGTPDLALAVDAPSQVLLGKQATVSLTASTAAGQPYGYNLSFRDVLPAGVSYVAGSASFAGARVDPQVIPGQPAAGQTTVIWRNVGDLSPRSEGTLTYRVAHATSGPGALGVGATYQHQASAYLNTDPRTVPAFSAAGAPTTGATGTAAGTDSTAVTAISIDVQEPSPEGELLRGAHDHQTVYTLRLENNTVNPTGPLTVEAFLPAGLEFLRCGAGDATTNAPTNPGSTEEWPGSGPLSGNVSAPAGCETPADVATLSTDPDGTGPLPSGIYTRVRWTGLAALAAGAARELRYVAAVPLRANTTAWTGAVPTTASLGQAANLDNNSGPRTQDEQALPTHATVAGTYNATTPVTSSHTATRSAEDVRIVKTASQETIADDQLTRWTLALATGEYRYVDALRVTDVLPDGLCPLDTTNLEGDATADCAPAGAGTAPSAPYTSATENADGSWTLGWTSATDPALARMQPSSTHVIAFTTRSRPDYQQDGAPEKPVLARDAWTNAVSVLGRDAQRCVGDPSCGGFAAKIDPASGLPAETDLDGTDDADASSASQAAGGPSIDKTIRAASTAVGADCSGAAFTDGPEGPYGPGDRVCFRLRVDFPSLLDTGSPAVTDVLPAGVTYESHAPTAANTVAVRSFSGTAGDGLVSWQLGDGSANAVNGQVFEVVLAARVTDPAAGQSADIKGNLMKVAHTNTAGQSFPLRDQADFTWTEPQLTLTEGVRDINDAPSGGNAANVDGGTVQAGDVVTIRIDVNNGGARDALDTEVWERLPAGVDCAAVSSISAAGTCSAGRITWTGVAVGAAGRTTLTYDYTVPAGARPATTFAHRAGVRSYQSDHNAGGRTTYVPASNIDPAVTAGQVNAAAADDPTSVATASPSVTHTATSNDISQSGNATGAATATIGERISAVATATIPAGTTLQDAGGPATFSIPLTAKQAYVAGSAVFTLDGAGLPAGFTTSYDAATRTLRVTFPADYVNAAGSGSDVLRVAYETTVEDISANRRTAGQTITATATLRYANGAGQTQTPNAAFTHTIVEPNLAVAKADDDADDRISPDQKVRYTLTVTNPSGAGVSAANDVVVTDTLPAGMTPVTASGTPVADEDATSPTAGGVWDADTRTITFGPASVAVGASVALAFDVVVDDPQVGNGAKVNTVVATATSYPSASTAYGAERDAATATALGVAGYRATASNTLRLTGATLAKAVDAPTATIGQRRSFRLDVTVPGGLDLFDVTVRDLLPDGLDHEAGSLTASCTGGCDLSASELPSTANGDGSTQLGFFLGDIAAAPDERVLRLTYTAHVDDRLEPEGTAVARGAVLTNTAAVHSNQTDAISGTPGSVPGAGAFSDAGPGQAAPVTVTEPSVTVDKDVGGQVGDTDARAAQPGDALTYTVTLTNTGNAAAHDISVTDRPDAELVDVAPSAGQSTTDLADAWTAEDPALRWAIASIPAGGTVTLTYAGRLAPSSALREADQAVNTADVPSYAGRPEAERTANGFDYRAYGTGAYDVAADTVTVAVDLPRIEVDLTTGGAGFPESAGAEVGQDFPWRAVVRNASPTAGAHGADLSVRLPRNWTYTPGSAAGGGGEPSVADDPAGTLLTWTDLADLAPGAARAVTFAARPTLQARTDPGAGAAHPHEARAWAAADDVTGASASADGPYADGPDGAQAVLLTPALAIAKTPDGGTAAAGATGTWTIRVDNPGTGTARGVRVTDTIPAGVTYTDGSATSPAPGLTEEGSTANPDGTRTVVWGLADLAPGAGATIVVPVDLDPRDDAGTSYVNTASVRAVEQPDGPTDTGTLQVVTRADLSVAKTASPATQAAGELVEFTLAVANAGPSEARDSTLTDALPAGLSLVSLEEGASTCSTAGQVVSCDFGTLAPGASRTVRLRARIGADRTGTLTNSASVATSTPDPVAANDEDEASVTVTERADLRVTKTVRDAAPVQTRDATFDVRVENRGPSDARDVALTDVLPAGMTLRSIAGAGATCAPGAAACDLGTIPAGEERTVTVVARADTTGAKVNAASVTTSADDPTPADDTGEAAFTVQPAVDLSLVKDAPATVAADGELDYTLTVRNDGPSPATDVAVEDRLPGELAFVSVSPSERCGFEEVSRILSCTLDTLAPGAEEAITVRTRVTFPAADGTVINTATVRAPQTDLDPSDDSDDATTLVGPAADLRMTKTASPDRLLQDRTVTYALDVDNLGPSAASGVTVTDALPAGTRFVALDAPAGWSCTTPAVGAHGTIACTAASVGAGTSAGFALRVRAEAAGTLDNVASVASDTPDPDRGNGTDDARVQVDPAVDLALEKTGPQELAAGAAGRYELTVANHGPSDATGVTVTDTLPDGLVLLGASSEQATCSADGNAVTCVVGDLAAGASASVAVTARASHAAAERTLTNTASARADQEDPRPADNTDDAATRVGPSANLRLAKTADPTVIAQNRTARYLLRVANDGPSTAEDVTLTDRLPEGVRHVSSDPGAPRCTQEDGTVTCRLGDLPKGGAATVAIEVRGVDLGTHANTAAVSSPTPDGDLADNEASADLTVGPTADLRVVKDGPATVDAGGEVTYTLAVTNGGPSASTDTQLVDTLPEGLTFVAASSEQGTHAADGRTVTWALGTLERGRTVRATVTARAAWAAGGTTLVNTASVSSREEDNDPSDDTDTHPVTVGPAADLSLVKDAPARVPAGGRLLYSLQVANAGPQEATDVRVADALPAGLRFVSAQATQGACEQADGTVSCRLGSLPAGGGAQVLIAADVAGGVPAGSTLRNTATVAGAEPDPDSEDRTDDAETVVDPRAIAPGALTATKTVQAGAVGQLGRPIPFTITVRNDTDRTATGVVAIDRPSAPVDVVSMEPQRGTCRRETLRCELGTLAGGEAVTIRVVMAPRQAGPLFNSVTVMSDQGDRDERDNLDRTQVRVAAAPTAFTLSKTAARRTVRAGGTVAYTIRARNTGGRAAAGVRVCDTPGAGLSFRSVKGARLSRGRACWTVAYWKPGQTRTWTVRARVDGSRVRPVNHATLTAANARARRARATVRVTGAGARRGGGVTG